MNLNKIINIENKEPHNFHTIYKKNQIKLEDFTFTKCARRVESILDNIKFNIRFRTEQKSFFFYYILFCF